MQLVIFFLSKGGEKSYLKKVLGKSKTDSNTDLGDSDDLWWEIYQLSSFFHLVIRKIV